MWDLADKSLDPLEVSAQLVQVHPLPCHCILEGKLDMGVTSLPDEVLYVACTLALALSNAAWPGIACCPRMRDVAAVRTGPVSFNCIIWHDNQVFDGQVVPPSMQRSGDCSWRRRICA